MSMFHVIEDAYAVTRSKGVYKQVKVYQRNKRIYVRHGSGFILVMRSNNTSHPDVRVDELNLAGAETKAVGVGYLELV